MTDRVRITDVAPRDGLQNEPGVITTADKAALVRAICAARVDEVEVTSFVSPKWIPQLADADVLLRALRDDPVPEPRPMFSALVPNERGLERAIRLRDEGCPLDKISVFTAVSDTFSKRNTNATIDETLERFKPVIDGAQRAGLRTRAYLSCVIACPYEGAMEPERSAELGVRLLAMGFGELDLGDTIGAGTPESIDRLIRAVEPAIPTGTPLTLHLHDTFGRAGACVGAAIEAGVRSFDGAAGGLGGCPFASTDGRRAPGNIATSTLLDVIERAGLTTTVDPVALAAADGIASRLTTHETP